MTATIRIAIVDDHPLFREGVARSLGEIGGFQVVGEGARSDGAKPEGGEKPAPAEAV